MEPPDPTNLADYGMVFSWPGSHTTSTDSSLPACLGERVCTVVDHLLVFSGSTNTGNYSWHYNVESCSDVLQFMLACIIFFVHFLLLATLDLSFYPCSDWILGFVCY